MRCPYCLEAVDKYIREERTRLHRCPHCHTAISKALLSANGRLQSSVGVVGFSGHGKTVYLTSLFSTLKRFSEFWTGYYFRSLDDFTHRIIYEQVPRFEQGDLPDSTPANFPSPAMVHYHDLPVFGDALVGFYDTAGEVFRHTGQVARAGAFVAHTDVVLFIVSLPDCPPGATDDELCRLLDTYIRAAEDRLAADIRATQRLVVVFTKADLLADRLKGRLRRWLDRGNDAWYAMDMSDKLTDLSLASIWIEEWLRGDLHCPRFVNMAKDHFREVRFTLVSALGRAYEDVDGSIRPESLRVLDPFLWLMIFARGNAEPVAKAGLVERLLSWLGRGKRSGLPGKKR